MMRTWKGRVMLAATLAFLAAPLGGLAVTICDIQQEYNEDWSSPLEGLVVTVTGVVTIPPGIFQPMQTSFYIQDGECGINVFDYDPLPFQLEIGDTIEVTGVVTEYLATTELVFSSITVVGPVVTEPVPDYLPLQDVTFEENEGRFLRTIGVVREMAPWYFYIEQPWSSAEVQVYGANSEVDMGVFDVGDTVDVTGILIQYDTSPPYNGGWELAPRMQEDMKLATPPPLADPEFWLEAALGVPSQVFRPDVNEIMPIAYLAPQGSTAVIEIYDLQGRRVRTLVEGEYTGYSSVPEFYKDDFYAEGTQGWDGRDDLRKVVPAGVYVCRLEVEDAEGTVSVKTAPIVVGVMLKD